jgi:hypothetical protein
MSERESNISILYDGKFFDNEEEFQNYTRKEKLDNILR